MKKKPDLRWIIKIIILSFSMSVVFTFASSEILGNAGYITAFLTLLVFIFIGILFDIIGVAVTAAIPAPFHSMASHKEKGAAEALKLLKNAEKVSSICNDVVGDISGIVSGSTSAIIVAKLVGDFSVSSMLVSLLVSGVVASLTIGGKAMGKTMAMNNSTTIVLSVGKIINFLSGIFHKRSRNKH